MDNKASRLEFTSTDKRARLSRRTLMFGSLAVAAVSASEQVACQQAASQEPPVPVPIVAGANYFDCVETHFDRMIHYSLDRFGSTRSAIWMSSLDIGTNELLQVSNELPANDMRFVPGAYWYADQPMLVAAHAVGARSGCKCYSDSADEYLRSYFHLMNEDAGLQSLRETYWSAADDKQKPVGLLRSMLPTHSPAWETLWRIDRDRTKWIIDHEVDRLSRIPNASLLDLNIAIESLRWLARQNDELSAAANDKVSLLASIGESQQKPPITSGRRAMGPRRQIVEALRFSANCLDAAKAIDEPWLRDIGLGLGSAACKSLLIDTQEKDGPTKAISELDLRVARYCLAIDGTSKEIQCNDVVIGMVNRIGQSLSSKDRPIETAGVFGHAIHFLQAASVATQRPQYLDLAKQVADKAIDQLFAEDCGMFRSRVEVDRCDAVDGIGYLMLALLAIDDDPTVNSALAF